MTRSRSSTTPPRANRSKRNWVLDADLEAGSNGSIMLVFSTALGWFPARALIERWLKAGRRRRALRAERGRNPAGRGDLPVVAQRCPAWDGTDRRSPLSPDRCSRRPDGGGVSGLVRYADDLVALCVSREQADEVKTRLAAWLAPRGLAFNEDKTRVVHLDDGFDFLGFNVRRYRGKLLIKPSKAALRRHRERLSAEMRALRGANVSTVIKRLDPIIGGMVGLLPDCRVRSGVRRAGQPHVAARLQVGHPWAPEQTEAVDCQPLLRPVQPVPA